MPRYWTSVVALVHFALFDRAGSTIHCTARRDILRAAAANKANEPYFGSHTFLHVYSDRQLFQLPLWQLEALGLPSIAQFGVVALGLEPLVLAEGKGTKYTDQTSRSMRFMAA